MASSHGSLETKLIAFRQGLIPKLGNEKLAKGESPFLCSFHPVSVGVDDVLAGEC